MTQQAKNLDQDKRSQLILTSLKNMLAGQSDWPDPMRENLGFRLVEVDKGTCVYAGTPKDEHRNLAGTIHGGWVMSILDSAATISVASALPAGKTCATASIEVKFIRPVRVGQTVHAIGEMLSLGENLGHGQARLIDKVTGKLLAQCTVTVAVLPLDRKNA